MTTVRRWEPFELDLTGTSAASVIFATDGAHAVADTFTAGERLLARFAPDRVGTWHYTITADDGTEIDDGAVTCVPAPRDDHGPIRAVGTRFRHADQTAHIPLATTALWWHRRPDEDRKRTLAALADSPITSVRISILPPESTSWPDAAELELIERAVSELRSLGRQAELVIFGDGTALGRTGWRSYLRQVVARFAAYRNVSWCLAIDADRAGIDGTLWDEALRLLAETDHGHRLCTIHAGPGFDFGDRRISHCSVRTDHARSSSILNDNFVKPAVLDGAVLEGNAPPPSTSPEPVEGWSGQDPSTSSGRVGDYTAEEVVLHAWETAVRGGFAAYGEWYLPDDPDRGPWWMDGGELRGESLPRLAFLADVLADVPGEPRYLPLRPDASTLVVPGEYYLQYLGAHRFRKRAFDLPDGAYRVELINTWDMTIEEVLRTETGSFVVEMPPLLYHAVRAYRC